MTAPVVLDDIEWLWEIALPDEARRHLIHRISELVMTARTQERTRVDLLERALRNLIVAFVNPYDRGEFEDGEVLALDEARKVLAHDR